MMAAMKALLLVAVCALAASCVSGRELKQTGALPVLAVVTTGGTIASVRDANGQLISAVDGATLLAAVPGLNLTVTVGGIYAAYKIDSSTATPENWRNVSAVVLDVLSNATVDAVLVLHGTDTMEQTAWFMQCIQGIGNQRKPVVITGAMRGADSNWPDGPENILASATVAASPKSAGLGVLVVMQDQIFSARFVTKVNANLLDAFGGTDGAGRIGHVIDGDVLYYSRPVGKTLCVNYPLPELSNIPNVALQQAYPGADGNVLDFYQSSGAMGVVINGLGSGNIGLGLGGKLNSTTYSFKVVITRTPEAGITSPDYGCIGCLGQLVLERGVVSAGNLNGFQARIVLLLALSRNHQVTVAALQKQYNVITFPK